MNISLVNPVALIWRQLQRAGTRLSRAASVAASAFCFWVMTTSVANATLLDKFAQGFVNIFSGVLAGAIGFVAFFVVGIFFAMGRMEFGRFAIIALGIVCVLGAANGVNYIQTNMAL